MQTPFLCVRDGKRSCTAGNNSILCLAIIRAPSGSHRCLKAPYSGMHTPTGISRKNYWANQHTTSAAATHKTSRSAAMLARTILLGLVASANIVLACEDAVKQCALAPLPRTLRRTRLGNCRVRMRHVSPRLLAGSSYRRDCRADAVRTRIRLISSPFSDWNARHL